MLFAPHLAMAGAFAARSCVESPAELIPFDP